MRLRSAIAVLAAAVTTGDAALSAFEAGPLSARHPDLPAKPPRA